MLGPLRLISLRRAATPLLLLLLALLSNVAFLHVGAATTDSDSLSALSTTAPASPGTCKRLTDANSPFLSGLALLVGIGGSNANFVADPTAFGPLDHALPTLSQCVAQTQPLSVLSSLVSSPATAPRALQCWNDLLTLSTTPLVDANGNVLFGDAVCPAFAKLAPCLTDVLLPEIERAMTNACCDPLRGQISAWFGAPLKDAVTSLVHVLGNAFCSQRAAITEPSTTENCGDSLQRNWQPPANADDEKAYWTLLNAFQIPNDQACKAARSEPIQTTMNQTQQFGASDVTPYGICYTPMDALQQYVRALPFWRVAGGVDMTTLVERAFVADSCLPGKDLLTWAVDDDGAVMKGVRVVDDLLTTIFAVSGIPTITAASPSVSPSPTTPTPKPTPAPTTEPPHSSSNEGSNDDDGSKSEKTEDNKPAFFDPSENADDDNGPTLEELAGANLTELVRAKLWELNLVADQLCIHIPNGVSCSFPGDVLTVPFPQIEPTTTDAAPSTTVGAVNSTTTNSTANAGNTSTSNSTSSAVRARPQRHDAALSVVVALTTVAAVIVQLL